MLPIWHAPNGSVLFTASATGGSFGGEYREGLWLRDPGDEPALLYLEGDPAPETAALFTAFSHSLRVDTGRFVTFQAALDSSTGYKNYTTFDTGIWEGSPDSIRLVVQSGHWAPGFPEDVNFEMLFVQGRTPIRTDAGLYWDSRVAGSIDFEAKGAHHWDGEQIRPIAITDDRAPNGSGTVRLDWPLPIAANNNGDVLLFSTGRFASPDGVWFVHQNRLWQKIVLVDKPLPDGSPAGLRLRRSCERW